MEQTLRQASLVPRFAQWLAMLVPAPPAACVGTEQKINILQEKINILQDWGFTEEIFSLAVCGWGKELHQIKINQM